MDESMHWADQQARKLEDKDHYVVEAGITPSGTVHVGNFREIITQELIVRALKDRGKSVDFLYAWDDYDVFRKVPKNMPQQDLLKKYLRMPITKVPDTFDTKHESYARHNEIPVEETIKKVGIFPTFLYQAKEYEACKFAEEMKQALEKTKEIKEILDKHRKEPLDDSWIPVAIFCDSCKKDIVTKIEYKGDYSLYYECKCGHSEEFDFRKKGIAKLAWRVDWPMRWHKNKVDFESAGKDHFAAGGSWDTCKEIIKAVWNEEGPDGFMYEWIKIKGGKQFSSSSGEVTTLQDVLNVYEPEIVRYLFASTRPDAEFAISFDLDVLKIYEDFDRCERIYYDNEPDVDEKEANKQKRIYELSCLEKPSNDAPFQPSFRHLSSIIQIYEDDLEKIKAFFKVEKESDVQRLKQRAECVRYWLDNHAGDEHKFKIQESSDYKPNDKEKEALAKLIEVLDKDCDEKQLFEQFYEISRELDINTKDFFKLVYKILINKERGPRLAPFIINIGKERVVSLLKNV